MAGSSDLFRTAIQRQFRATEMFNQALADSLRLSAQLSAMVESSPAARMIRDIEEQTRRLQLVTAPDLQHLGVAKDLAEATERFVEIQNAAQRQFEALIESATPKLPDYSRMLMPSVLAMTDLSRSLSLSSKLADQIADHRLGAMLPPDWAQASDLPGRLGDYYTAESRVLTSLATSDVEPDVRLTRAAEVGRERLLISRLSHVVTVPPSSRTVDLEGESDEAAQSVLLQLEDDLLARLSELDEDCTELWTGAGHAVQAGGPDAARHAGVSLRELLGHVLRRLSPDEAVKEWTTREQDFHNGKPTRKTRIRYITRAKPKSVQRYVAADMKALAPFMELLNKATHEVPATISLDLLRAAQARVASLLHILLTQGD